MEGQNFDDKELEAQENEFKKLLSKAKNYIFKVSPDSYPEMVYTSNMNVSELNYIIRTLGFDPEGEDIKCMIQKDDEADTIGRIAYDDLLYIMHKGLAKHITMEDLMNAFTLLDPEKTEKISFEKIKEAADELGEPFTDEELHELINAVDLDGDGQLSRDELLHILKDTSF